MKKGFTLVEVLTTLAILAVIGAIITPMVINIMPDNRFYAFKKAFYTLSDATQEIVAMYPSGDLSGPIPPPTVPPTPKAIVASFCTNFTNRVNTFVGCAGGTTTTSDGMTWSNLDSAYSVADAQCQDYNEVVANSGGLLAGPPSNYKTVRVDINGSNNGPNLADDDIFTFGICANGKVLVPPGGVRANDFVTRMRRDTSGRRR